MTRAKSNATGQGNVITQCQASAAARLTVICKFTPTTTPVQPPAEAPLMLVGIGALAMVSRAKRKS